jgi:hypothetical protein
MNKQYFKFEQCFISASISSNKDELLTISLKREQER